ncbi:MAG: hypothetical protein M1825_001340 [Sarcosagium campestre]|nr:MAG: hypothetical protein M1825_001340 [Sarcosagium campestre]
MDLAAQDLPSLYTRHLRQINRPPTTYACPFCPQRPTFQLDVRLFRHVELEHPQIWPSSTDERSLTAFKENLQNQARGQGPKGHKLATSPEKPSTLAVEPSRGIKRETVDDPQDLSAPQLQLPVHNLPSHPKVIDDIKQLTLAPGSDARVTECGPNVSAEAPLSPISVRKRGPGADNELRGPSPPHSPRNATHPTTRTSEVRSARRSKAITNSAATDEATLRVQHRTVRNLNGRPSSSGSKRLFNYATDDATAASNKDPALTSTLRQARSRREINPRRRDAKAFGWDGRPKSNAEPQQPSEPGASPSPAIERARPSHRTARSVRTSEEIPNEPKLILEPETRPISQEQLVQEVRGIYAGLVMVEQKCEEVDRKQAIATRDAEPGKPPTLSHDQWQALIALHRALLHEHHDFMLASQHPSATPALKSLAAKYAMPARMWRHGIHAFLELLRHRLPESLDHMLAFIYLAYSMVALLYETVPSFEATWIECLGDLGRYRMAIEDDDIRDRKIWTGVSQSWYSKAADKSPNVGRLYHHLAILARPKALRQLYYYTRSLTCVQAFLSARESILTLFDPILSGSETSNHRAVPVDITFIQAHGLLFTDARPEAFHQAVTTFVNTLDENIVVKGTKWKRHGVFIVMTNIAALFGYGATTALFRVAFDAARRENGHGLVAPIGPSRNIGPPQTAGPEPSGEPKRVEEKTMLRSGTAATGNASDQKKSVVDPRSNFKLAQAGQLAFGTLAVALQRIGDDNVIPHVHVFLVFLRALTRVEQAIRQVESRIPWKDIASYLNSLDLPKDMETWSVDEPFPEPEDPKEVGRPLPEDFAMRGQLWSQELFPAGWFENAGVDEDERSLELPSMAQPRLRRVAWLGFTIASCGRWLLFDASTCTFSVEPRLAQALADAERAEYELGTCTPEEDSTDVEMLGEIETIQSCVEDKGKVEGEGEGEGGRSKNGSSAITQPPLGQEMHCLG